jgi:hypothetical protein
LGNIIERGERERERERESARERERERERKREKREMFSRFSENSFRFSEKRFRFPRIVLREHIFCLEIWEEKIYFSRLVPGNGNGKTMVFILYYVF